MQFIRDHKHNVYVVIIHHVLKAKRYFASCNTERISCYGATLPSSNLWLYVGN